MRSVSAWLVLAVVAATPLLAADPTVETTTFSLHRVGSRDALTLLRTILDIKQFELVDDSALQVTATSDRLELASQILSLIDGPDGTDQGDTFADGEEFVVAVVPLRGTLPKDAMKAMRELHIHKIGIVSSTNFVIVRDSEPQVKAALARLGDLRPLQP